MSYAQTGQPAVDAWLMQQVAPSQGATLEQLLEREFFALRLITPIGRVSYAHLKEARAVQAGQPKRFSATLLMNPASTGDLWRAIIMVANCRWPSEQVADPRSGQTVTLTGEHLLNTVMPELQQFAPLALHNPLRDGNEAFMKDPKKCAAYWGTHTINASSSEDKQPVVFDARMNPTRPEAVYSGCYARFFITLFAFPKPNQQNPKRGIGVALNSIQFARDGEKFAGFDVAGQARERFAAGGPLPVDPGQPSQPGFGFNPSGFPGAAQPPQGGFAPPPQQPYQQPAQQYAPQPASQIAGPQQQPQQPQQPAPGQQWAPPQPPGGFPPR